MEIATRAGGQFFNPSFYIIFNNIPESEIYNYKFNLYNHWKHIGKNKNYIPYKFKIPHDFNWNLYITINNLSNINDEFDAYLHYILIGKNNGMFYPQKNIDTPSIHNNIIESKNIKSLTFNFDHLKLSILESSKLLYLLAKAYESKDIFDLDICLNEFEKISLNNPSYNATHELIRYLELFDHAGLS